MAIQPVSEAVLQTPLIDSGTGQMAWGWQRWVSGVTRIVNSLAGVAVVSFGTGAPGGTSTEGFIYFDTSASPYQLYVYHSGSWHPAS